MIEKLKKIFKKKGLIIISIDPGVKNLAIRVERHFINKDDKKEIEFFKAEKYRLEKISRPYIYKFFKPFTVYPSDRTLVLIERQMYDNYPCITLQCYLECFFYGVGYKVYVVGNKLKNRVICNYGPNVKKASIAYAIGRCKKHNDYYTLGLIMKHTKKDDYCDTISQIDAFLEKHSICS